MSQVGWLKIQNLTYKGDKWRASTWNSRHTNKMALRRYRDGYASVINLHISHRRGEFSLLFSSSRLCFMTIVCSVYLINEPVKENELRLQQWILLYLDGIYFMNLLLQSSEPTEKLVDFGNARNWRNILQLEAKINGLKCCGYTASSKTNFISKKPKNGGVGLGMWITEILVQDRQAAGVYIKAKEKLEFVEPLR